MGGFGRHLAFQSISFPELLSHFKMSKLVAQFAAGSKAYLAPRFATFVKYGKSELTPPTPGEIPQAIGQALKLVKSGTTFQFRHLTVKEGFLNACVAVEVSMWFFIGECIGKRGLIGYDVADNVHH